MLKATRKRCRRGTQPATIANNGHFRPESSVPTVSSDRLRVAAAATAVANGDEPRTLMVAATGGHLAELVRLSPRLVDLPARRLWVTFDTIQSRTLLAGEDVIFIPFTAPRAIGAVLRNVVNARSIMDAHNVVAAVSTGSAVANSFLPLARAKGIPCFYIECSARTHGPSVTGRALGAVPGVRRFTQFERWEGPRWSYAGSVFDSFVPSDQVVAPSNPLSVVVTVGTLAYSFRRLFARLSAILPPDSEVLWQTGQTPVHGLAVNATPFIDPDSLDQAMRRADVVIAHAGIGSALASLDAGRPPILVPRRKRYGEHVDDHQLEIAETLSARGVGHTWDADELTVDRILQAASQRVVSDDLRPMRLLN